MREDQVVRQCFTIVQDAYAELLHHIATDYLMGQILGCVP